MVTRSQNGGPDPSKPEKLHRAWNSYWEWVKRHPLAGFVFTLLFLCTLILALAKLLFGGLFDKVVDEVGSSYVCRQFEILCNEESQPPVAPSESAPEQVERERAAGRNRTGPTPFPTRKPRPPVPSYSSGPGQEAGLAATTPTQIATPVEKSGELCGGLEARYRKLGVSPGYYPSQREAATMLHNCHMQLDAVNIAKFDQNKLSSADMLFSDSRYCQAMNAYIDAFGMRIAQSSKVVCR